MKPSGKYDNPKLKKQELKIEQPIYGYNGFLLGIADGISERTFRYEFTMTNYYGNEEEVGHGEKTFAIIYEIKPVLNSVSAALGQLKSYINSLANRRRYEKIFGLIVTLDKETKFDNMLKSQGINILHLSCDETGEIASS